jgi:hypothetical protein
VGKTKTQIRSQVKLERHRGVSQGFIYMYGSESESEYEAKYSTVSKKPRSVMKVKHVSHRKYDIDET